MTAVERVGVVGCGLMGSGIAEMSARAGLDVVLREIDDEALAAGLNDQPRTGRPRRLGHDER